MTTKTSLKTTIQGFVTHLSMVHSAAMAVERRLALQKSLRRGQNLQMMDFAELGRPSLRAHLADPVLARILPSTVAVARVLKLSRWSATVVVYVLAILAGALLAAVGSHFTLS